VVSLTPPRRPAAVRGACESFFQLRPFPGRCAALLDDVCAPSERNLQSRADLVRAARKDRRSPGSPCHSQSRNIPERRPGTATRMRISRPLASDPIGSDDRQASSGFRLRRESPFLDSPARRRGAIATLNSCRSIVDTANVPAASARERSNQSLQVGAL